MSFKEIAPENFEESVFKVIGKDWLLLAGTKDGKTNAMTASWGGMGIMWALIHLPLFVTSAVSASTMMSVTFL